MFSKDERMKLTWKKTILILSCITALCALLIFIGSLYFTDYLKYHVFRDISNYTGYVRDYLRYDKMKLLATESKDQSYFNVRMVENTDGSFMIFSLLNDYKTLKWRTSIIKTDKDFKQLWEKIVPRYTGLSPMELTIDEENYRLISPDFSDSIPKVIIRTFNNVGDLLTEKELKSDIVGDDFNALQFVISGNIAYIFCQKSEPHSQVVSEVDIRSGKLIRQSSLPLYTKDMTISQAKYDSKNHSVYFAGTETNFNNSPDKNNRVMVWKYDASGKFAQIINQVFPDKTSIGLCIDDIPYLITSAEKLSKENNHPIDVYAISDNKLNKLWTYQSVGKSQNRDIPCLKVSNNWYIGDMYKKGTELFPAITKFDSQGNFLSQTKPMPIKNGWMFQLFQAKDGRIIYSGTYQGFMYPGGRPFVSVVK